MYEIILVISYVFCFAVFYVSFVLNSPLIYLVIFMLTLAPLRLPESDELGGLLIIIAWSICLMVGMLFLHSKRVAIRRFDLFEIKRISFLRFAAFLVLIIILGYFWINAIGLEDFTEHHRRERTEFAGMARVLFRSCLFYSYIVIAFYEHNISKRHLFLAIVIMLIGAYGGYVTNRRGDVLIPILMILVLRYFHLFSPTKKFKFMFAGVVILSIGVVTVVEMTAQRSIRNAHETSWFDGFQSLQSTISGERGNGFSPNMDWAVIDYVDRHGAFLEWWTLFSGFYGLIPRALWSEKPYVGVGPIVGAIVFRTGGGIIGEGAGTPVSIAAQMSAIFGSYFYVLGVILTVFLLCFLFFISKKYPILFVPVFAASPWLMGSDIGRTQIIFTLNIIFVIIIFQMLGLRMRYQARSSRAGWRRRIPGLAGRRSRQNG